MQAVLVMFKTDGSRRSFSLARDVTVLGRREDCDLRIPLSDVSRKHCRFVKDGDALKLEDLGSSNGTHVNGQRIQETVLNAGDTVQLGPVVFVVQVDGVPAEDQMQPVVAAAAEEPAAGNGGEEAAAAEVATPEEVAAEPEEAQVLEEVQTEDDALAHLSVEGSAHGDSVVVDLNLNEQSDSGQQQA